MPIVFVHGVNTRKIADYEAHRPPRKREDTYDEQIESIKRKLSRHTLPLLPERYRRMPILDAYWGNLGARFPRGMAALPRDDAEHFGGVDEIPVPLLEAAARRQGFGRGRVLLPVAQDSLDDLVDLLWSVADDGGDATLREQLTGLAMDALNYVSEHPSSGGGNDWLTEGPTDRDLLELFIKKVEENAGRGTTGETFGGGGDRRWDPIRTAQQRIEQMWRATANLTGEQLARVRFSRFGEGMGYFFGDVAQFLRNRTEIINQVAGVLEAAPRTEEDEPLVVIAHSMGGNIVYDILAHHRPDLRCSVLVTVGSQVGLFEELELFKSAAGGASASTAPARASKPKNLEHWLNVYDTSDVLGYAAGRVFTGVVDYEFPTGKIAHWSHSGYIKGESFYRRLGDRLRDLL